MEGSQEGRKGKRGPGACQYCAFHKLHTILGSNHGNECWYKLSCTCASCSVHRNHRRLANTTSSMKRKHGEEYFEPNDVKKEETGGGGEEEDEKKDLHSSSSSSSSSSYSGESRLHYSVKEEEEYGELVQPEMKLKPSSQPKLKKLKREPWSEFESIAISDGEGEEAPGGEEEALGDEEGPAPGPLGLLGQRVHLAQGRGEGPRGSGLSSALPTQSEPIQEMEGEGPGEPKVKVEVKEEVRTDVKEDTRTEVRAKAEDMTPGLVCPLCQEDYTAAGLEILRQHAAACQPRHLGEEREWTCLSCTFDNSATAPVCAVCRSHRGEDRQIRSGLEEHGGRMQEEEGEEEQLRSEQEEEQRQMRKIERTRRVEGSMHLGPSPDYIARGPRVTRSREGEGSSGVKRSNKEKMSSGVETKVEETRSGVKNVEGEERCGVKSCWLLHLKSEGVKSCRLLHLPLPAAAPGAAMPRHPPTPGADHPLQPTPGGPHRAPPSLPPRSTVWAELRGVWAELVHQQLAGLLFFLPINQWVDPVGQGRASAVGILLGRGKWFPARVRERTGVEVRVLGVEGFWQRMLLVRPAQAGEEDRRVRDAAAMVIEHMARFGFGCDGEGRFRKGLL